MYFVSPSNVLAFHSLVCLFFPACIFFCGFEKSNKNRIIPLKIYLFLMFNEHLPTLVLSFSRLICQDHCAYLGWQTLFSPIHHWVGLPEKRSLYDTGERFQMVNFISFETKYMKNTIGKGTKAHFLFR